MIEPLNKEKINAIKESNKKDLLLPFDCVYVLTLIDNQSRIYNFYEEMAKLGVANEIKQWNACSHPHTNDIGKYLKDNGKYILGSESYTAFNCTREHYNICKDALYNGYDSILVFEDDFQFIKYYDKIRELFQKPKPNGWNLIQYGHFRCSPFYNCKEIEYIPITNVNHDWGTMCYALSRGVKYYINYMDSNYGVADYPLWNCYRHIDGAYQTTMNLWFPYINYESTIQV